MSMAFLVNTGVCVFSEADQMYRKTGAFLSYKSDMFDRSVISNKKVKEATHGRYGCISNAQCVETNSI